MKSTWVYFSACLILLMSGLALCNANVSFALVETINEWFPIKLDVFFRAEGLFCFGVMMVCLAFMLALYHHSWKLDMTYQSGIAMFILISGFIYILLKTKQNVPVFDEYTGMFDFLCSYSKSTSIQEKLHLLFEPYFECRIPVPYLVVLIISSLPGSLIPLNLIVTMNALVLLLIGLLLFRSMAEKSKLLYFIPWFLMLVFHTEFMQSSFNSLSGLCYNGVLLFSLLAFHFIRIENIKARILALFFALLAIFTFGNGLLLIPLIVFESVRSDRWKKSLFFILPLLLAFIFYFNDYHPVRPEKIEFNFGNFLLYVPLFLGSAFQFFYSGILPFLIGLSVLTLFAFATWKSYYRKNPILYYFLSFLILTAFLNAAFRSSISAETALRLRYGIFSSFAVLCSVLVFLDLFPEWMNKKVLERIAIAAVLYNLLTTHFFYPESVLTIVHNKEMLREWKSNGKIKSGSPYYPGGLEPVLECSDELGFWKPVL